MDQRKTTVLLVEDDGKDRKFMRRQLERMGLSVVEVADGRSAVNRLSESAPDLVCLDLMLPELSGYEVCEFMRRTDALKGVPILVVSARALPEDRAHAVEVGASAYLVKPFRAAQFSKQVSALLRGVESS